MYVRQFRATYFVVLHVARNCLAFALDYIVMQMRKRAIARSSHYARREK